MPAPSRYRIDADRVYGRLHQGAKPPVGYAVQRAGYSALVVCAKELQGGGYQGVAVHHCALNDDEEEHPLLPSELSRAKATAHVVAAWLDHDQHVLVTCAQGRNRSGLVTCLALHLVTGWPGTRCIAQVRAARPRAMTNDSFVKAIAALPDRTGEGAQVEARRL